MDLWFGCVLLRDDGGELKPHGPISFKFLPGLPVFTDGAFVVSRVRSLRRAAAAAVHICPRTIRPVAAGPLWAPLPQTARIRSLRARQRGRFCARVPGRGRVRLPGRYESCGKLETRGSRLVSPGGFTALLASRKVSPPLPRLRKSKHTSPGTPTPMHLRGRPRPPIPAS